MSWLYQALPLASTFVVTDETEALSGSESVTEQGSCVGSRSVALAGTQALSGVGSMDLGDTSETIAGTEVAVEQGSLVRTNFVRLRSRKTAQGGSTAEYLLNSNLANTGQGTVLNNVSKLLGGSGVTMSQQSFPSKSVARLLVGQERTMSRGNITYVPSGPGSSLPTWIQLPTQEDEKTYYETDFGTDSGKDAVWTYATSEANAKLPTFTAAPTTTLLRSGHVIHDDTEGDDLWTHYMMYKRTNNSLHFTWAQAWRNFFIDEYATHLVEVGGTGIDASPNTVFGASCNDYDHLYGQGLVMWGLEQNDPAARAAVLTIANHIEADTLGEVTIGVTNMSGIEGRRFARRLIFLCYLTMMEPIPRWITLRDYIIDAWVNSPGWCDTTDASSPTIIGGTHRTGVPVAGHGWASNAPIGLRYDHSFMYGLKFEAFWLAYKLTGRADVKNQLIEMARYVLHYAWDPLHANPMMGGRWGHRPVSGPGSDPYAGTRNTAGFLHEDTDEFIGTADGVPQNPPPTINTNPNVMSSANYEPSVVNGLVYAYKLTGEQAFLKRAREHFRQATCYGNDTLAGGPWPKLNQTQVRKFIDTEAHSSLDYFDWNKGQLQYCSRVFENGGLPTLETGAAWTPLYQVPTAPGQVVKIGADAAVGAHGSGGSVFPTNVMADIRWPEIGAAAAGNQAQCGGDSRSEFIESYSQGGAIVAVGSGGHKGTPIYGALLFDFEDARWKRIWTTQGDPGVDNTTNSGPPPSLGGPPYIDLRNGTTTHGCPNFERDNIEWYCGTGSSGHQQGSQGDMNSDHWSTNGGTTSGGGSQTHQRNYVPLKADPRHQSWEVTQEEPAAFDATSNPHGWKFPGTWNGLQSLEYPGRFTTAGYMCESLSFHPPIAGTLHPDQGEIPAPAHVWDHYYELLPEHGGGPKGSVVTGRHQNAGEMGTTACKFSNKFDLYTGYWSQFSITTSGGLTQPTGNASQAQPSAVAGCVDPGTSTSPRRAYQIAKRWGKDSRNRINYINLDETADYTWHSFDVGGGGSTLTTTTRTESLVVDPDRRLLIMPIDESPWLYAFDLQTLGVTGIAEPFPSLGSGGFKIIPHDDILGVQSYLPWGDSAINPRHNGSPNRTCHWRYYPPNGNFYRINPRGMAVDTNPPYPDITVLQRLTPPAIIATPRPNFYYTTEASSGRWTIDEITVSQPLPCPDSHPTYSVAGNSWFHYVPALQCFAWCPGDMGSLRNVQTRRCVFLIKPS